MAYLGHLKADLGKQGTILIVTPSPTLSISYFSLPGRFWDLLPCSLRYGSVRSLELMTRRLTYSVRLSPAYCQFLRLGLDLSRYELPRPVKLYLPPPPTNGVPFGKIGTQETYFKTTFQRQFIAKRQKAKTAAKEKMSEENVKAALT